MNRVLLAAFAAPTFATACAPAAGPSGEPAAPARMVAESASSPPCPAADFPGFLRKFASDSRVRAAHTAPLVQVTEWIDASVVDPVEQTTPVPAARYNGFSLSFHRGHYFHLDVDGNRYGGPVAVAIKPHGSGYEVRYVFGMSEGNSWLFERHRQCWRLSADHEPTWE